MYTKDELLEAWNNPDVVSLRKSITLYKKNDEAYARFRVLSTNILKDFILAKLENRKMSKYHSEKLKGYLKQDVNHMFIDFVNTFNDKLCDIEDNRKEV